MQIVQRLAAGLVVAFLSTQPALSAEPSLHVSQYEHTAWTSNEALSDGDIGSIAQTSDGYLWFGTRFGLVRFDGVRQVFGNLDAHRYIFLDRL